MIQRILQKSSNGPSSQRWSTIFTSDLIESTKIHIQSPLEVIAVSIRLKTPLCICNIYLPDSTNLTLNDLNDIIKQLPKPFIFLGDFNSRSQMWGSHHTDQRGKTMEKFIENEHLILLNTGDYTRHNAAHNSFSAIDLTITNSSFSPKTEWNVLNEYSSSDHWPISIKILEQLPPTPSLDRWNLKNPNWELYRDIISQDLIDHPINLRNTSNQTEINSMIDNFSNIILNAAKLTIGKINVTKQKKIVPWWNMECNSAIRAYKKSLNKFKKIKSIDDHIILKKLRAQAKYIIKKCKTESWQKYINSINSSTSPTVMWNKIKAIKGITHQPLPSNLNHNGIPLSSPTDISEAFAHHFTKNSCNSNYEYEFIIFKQKTEANIKRDLELNFHQQENSLNQPFNITELHNALSRYKSKSPGPDGISYSFILNLPKLNHETFLKIYNIIWDKGVYPDQWRNAIVIPIPKPNKNKFDTANYRPISLINTLSKTLKKMVNKRFVWHLETSNIITNEQCRFRRNHSTLDTFSSLHTDITNAKNQNQHLILIALDLEKAYDMVWRNRVLKIIQECGINGKMFQFLQNFLNNRTIQVKAHNKLSNSYLTENGLPQGSVINVTMFLLAINNIFKEIPKPIKHLLFADDCHIYCSGQDIKITVEILQQALNTLQSWSNKTGFKFSPGKSQCISFHTRTIGNHKLFLKDSEIPFCKSLRILGIIFDHKLKWTHHLKKLKSSCKTKMNIIKTLSHHTGGADTKCLLTIYKSLILSQINYGSIIYSTASENLLKILDPIHNEGIRISIGAFRTSPIDSILCYAGELPLKLLREKNILNYGIKRRSTPNHIGYNHTFNNQNTNPTNMIRKQIPSIHDTFSLLCNKFKIHTSVKNKITFPNCPPWNWKIQLNTELTMYNKHETNPIIFTSHFKEIIQNKYLNFLQIYTDSSKSTHGTGFAIIMDEIKILHKLPPESSNFSAENYAILEAIKLIKLTI